jgi:hypothetical protein
VAEAATQSADLALRRVFIDTMTAVLGKSGQERTIAFMNLVNAMTGSAAARETLARAFDALESEGYDDNPFISLARARLAIERWKVEAGPGLDSDVVGALAQTAERLNDATVSRTAGSALGDTDIAVLNQEMSRQNGELGNGEEALRRAWIARFAGMSAEERARYREGSIVSIVPPGVKFVTAPSANERELDALDARWAERQRMEEEIRQIGNPKPRNADRSDYFNKDFDEPIPIEGAVRTKKRGTSKGYQPKYKPSSSSITLRDPKGLAQYKAATGSIDLVILVLQMIGADRRMNELADYTRQRDALSRRVSAEENRAMPPKPERIRALIRDLLELGARTRDTARKQEIQRALSGLRGLLEESRAAWPGQ